MTGLQLVFPMFALVLLTFGVAAALFRARVRSVREGQTTVSYFRIFQGSAEPEYLAKATRHFSNLFETPTLFYAGCLTAMVARVNGPVIVAMAWAFVAARVLHAWIHLGSWICLLALWIHVAVEVAVRE
jgi:hypothetical protein